ncbi:MAG: hypothetical protein LBE35_03440 [Clostridiales bacterium]|jgi:protein phosphatase|nr:hypothetical protein [Clostridiales bacterium]
MDSKLHIKKIEIPEAARLICVADLRGELRLFKRLLKEIDFGGDDILVILGNIYAKGKETLDFVMELAKFPNVHAVKGNIDAEISEDIGEERLNWLKSLPHIIESKNYIFVHAGLGPGKLEEQDPDTCMMTPAFFEKYDGPAFDKWVITGYWPVDFYCHEIPSHNPMVNREKRIIAIDGGIGIRSAGQMNAFMIEKGKPSWQSVDGLGTVKIQDWQEGKPGTINIAFEDRFIEILEEGPEFSLVRHLESGKTLHVPTNKIWRQGGDICVNDQATDHILTVRRGDTIAIVEEYSDRIYTKVEGEAGWIMAGEDN